MRLLFPFSFLIALGLAWTGCSSPASHALGGQLEGAGDATVTLSRLGQKGYIAFDTVQADASGAFAASCQSRPLWTHIVRSSLLPSPLKLKS